MNRSSVSDQNRSMPVFFTGCVSPDAKSPNKSQKPEKTPILSLSPKDFENIKQGVDTLLSNKNYDDPQQNLISPSKNSIEGRSLLHLPTDNCVKKLNGKELFGTDVEQTVKEDLLKNSSTSSNYKIRRPKRLFPDSTDDNLPTVSNVPPKRYRSETSSSYILNSSYSSSFASTSSNANFYEDNIDSSPGFPINDHHVRPPVENSPSSRKRKALLPHPEERWKTVDPSFPPSNVWEQLSKDIWSLYDRDKQSPEVYEKKMVLRQKLHDILRLTFPTCGLYVVGSSMTGLGGNSSDMDMCLMISHEEVDQKAEAISFLRAASNSLYKYDFIRNIQLVPAKVPILKFKDTVSCIEVDLNVNNSVGIRNTQLLNSYSRIDKRVPPLVILVKMWARQHNINDAKHNTLSSYSLVLMVIHFLQYGCSPPVVPCLQQIQQNKYYPDSDVRTLLVREELPKFVSENGQPVGQLFLGFLNYFSNEFDFTNNAISIREGCVIPKRMAMNVTSPKNKKAHWKYVCIEEPFELTNTACSVFKDTTFYYIQNVFRNCWNILNRNKKLQDVLRFNV